MYCGRAGPYITGVEVPHYPIAPQQPLCMSIQGVSSFPFKELANASVALIEVPNAAEFNIVFLSEM